MVDRLILAETSLGRMADVRGDVTADVIARYYNAMPATQASFEQHGMGNRSELEGRMVGEIAFLLLKWAENPAVSKIEQGTTIIHHQDTLEVSPHWYLGMIDAFLLELFETIPTDKTEEYDLWRTIRSEIADFIDSLRGEFWRRDDGTPLPEFADASHSASHSQRSS